MSVSTPFLKYDAHSRIVLPMRVVIRQTFRVGLMLSVMTVTFFIDAYEAPSVQAYTRTPCVQECLGSVPYFNGRFNRCPYCVSGRACPSGDNIDEDELCCRWMCGEGSLTAGCGYHGDFTLDIYRDCFVSCEALPDNDPGVCQEGYCPPDLVCGYDERNNECGCQYCGNGILETDEGEKCDYAASDPINNPAAGIGSTCREDCTFCGDFTINGDETCDGSPGCRYPTAADACTKCGDGNVESSSGEQCDDEDQDNSDYCTNNCKIAFCGDGIVGSNLFIPEECDDGNTENEDGCSSSCELEFCGDGVKQEGLGEECDDGNRVNTDSCRNTCILPVCGDRIVDPNEDCDDGKNGDNYDWCSDICKALECSSDSDCDGQTPLGGVQCGFCINGSMRANCFCNEGVCNNRIDQDCSCTTGECNLCAGDLLTNPCASNPQKPCKFCWLDSYIPPIPGPGPVEKDTCQPYPNAEILWPEECGDGSDDGSSRNSSQRSSSSSSNTSDTSESTSFSESSGSSESASDSDSFSFSFSFSFSNSNSSDFSGSSTSRSTTGTGSSSFSEGDDSADDGGFSSEGADDSGDSGDSSFSFSDSSESETDTGTDGDETGSSSSSSSYDQCDFCPACVACRRCGIGMTNLCDAEECGSLGLCVFQSGLVSGTCTADPEICSVCQ